MAAKTKIDGVEHVYEGGQWVNAVTKEPHPGNPFPPPAMPTVGRIVHINMKDGQVRPMMVTAVFDHTINGTVFLDGEKNDKENVPDALDREGPSFARAWSREEGTEPGEWNWPPRV